MKKRILSHLLICIITCILVVPFSIVKGTTNVTLYSSSLFDYGAYNVYYASNTGGYVITDMFDFIQVPMQWESCTVIEVAFNNYYDGQITMKFAGNISTNLWECYLEGDGAYITNLSSTDVTIMLVHCQKFYIYGFCGNDNDINLRPKTSEPFVYPDGSLKPYTSGSEELLNYNRSIISNFEYHENFNNTDSTHLDFVYQTANLNDNAYLYKTNSNRGVKRINVDFKILNYTDGNYYVFNIYFMSNSILPENAFDNLKIRTRDNTSSRVFNVPYIKYVSYYKFDNYNQSIFNILLYVPVYYLSVYIDSRYQLDFYNFDVSARATKFAYLGMVETLPSETNVVNPSSDINQANNDLTTVTNDIENFESTITTDFYNNMNNINLNDYNIFSQLSDTSYYFKTYINDFFNHIGDFKALFIVPIIVTVLMLIVGWVV